MKKTLAGDFLIYDKSSNTYRTNPEQLVRDDVEKHYWKHVMQTVLPLTNSLAEAMASSEIRRESVRM